MLNPNQIEKVVSTLNTIHRDLTKISLFDLAKKNKPFAIGVLRQLCDTEYCLIPPAISNKFSKIVFRFPENANEDFLNIILDCIELLSQEEAIFKIAKAEDEVTGYVLGINNEDLIRSLVFIDPKNAWCLAGLLFVEFNKNRLENSNISLISSDLFGETTFMAVDKFKDLLL